MKARHLKLVEGSLHKKVLEEFQYRTDAFSPSVSLETELPECLYRKMNAFLGSNPQWDQYSLLSSALANFLLQNGCEDRAVRERYLKDLFSRSKN